MSTTQTTSQEPAPSGSRSSGSRRLLFGLVTAVVALSFAIGTATAGHENALLRTKLKGAAEVDSAGDPNGKGQIVVFGVDDDSTTLCYALTVSKLDGTATAAHIHKGKRGENGPPVAFLAAPGDGTAADCLTEGEEGKFAEGQTVEDILENPGQYYVNVHTEAYPAGAVRGQLRQVRNR